MIVNRTSWHFKLNERIWWFVERSGNNLCKYFWMTVWSIFFVMFVVGMLGIYIGFLVFFGITEPYAFLFVVMIVTYVVFLIGLPILSIWLFRKIVPNTEILTPSILTEYVKAKKNKYCPMIDYQ